MRGERMNFRSRTLRVFCPIPIDDPHARDTVTRLFRAYLGIAIARSRYRWWTMTQKQRDTITKHRAYQSRPSRAGTGLCRLYDREGTLLDGSHERSLAREPSQSRDRAAKRSIDSS